MTSMLNQNYIKFDMNCLLEQYFIDGGPNDVIYSLFKYLGATIKWKTDGFGGRLSLTLIKSCFTAQKNAFVWFSGHSIKVTYL